MPSGQFMETKWLNITGSQMMYVTEYSNGNAMVVNYSDREYTMAISA